MNFANYYIRDLQILLHIIREFEIIFQPCCTHRILHEVHTRRQYAEYTYGSNPTIK